MTLADVSGRGQGELMNGILLSRAHLRIVSLIKLLRLLKQAVNSRLHSESLPNVYGRPALFS